MTRDPADSSSRVDQLAPLASDAPSPEAWITVGRIVAAQGLNGEVRVYPESDFPDRFLVAGDRWLRYPGKAEPELAKLTKGRYIPKKNLYVVKFEGVNYRDQAEALRDVELLVPESDRPQLDDGEFHVMDLVGLDVFLQETGEPIGKVVDLISVGNDLLEIELPMPAAETAEAPSQTEAETKAQPTEAELKAIKAQERASFTRRKGRRKAARERKKAARPKKAPRLLVPFVHDIVPLVDLEAGRIEITPPPGLLDLSR